MTTSEQACLDALREAAERLGESPTKVDYEELGLTPASATIIRTVGGWNEAKERAGLETNPSTGSRVAPKPKSVNCTDEEWAEMSVDQRWHYRNVEHNTERTLRRRARLRAWVDERKIERGCADCGVDDPACLDCHHVEPGEKRMAITRMVTFGYGREQLDAELEKCEVLCANCHRIRHGSGDGDRYEWLADKKRAGGGCVRCDETDPACLDFHHPGEKGATVARLVADGRPREEVAAEIERCTVLCANCHRKEHVKQPREQLR